MVIGSEELKGRSGHQAGRQLLQRLYGKELPEIGVTDRGKPYFINEPLYFSISHTKSRVFCVLSDSPVGIDAEELGRNINLALADKILSEAERLRFEQATDRRLTLLKLWVLKEAQAKATGEGLRGYPNNTDFSPDDPRLQIMDGHVVAVIEMR